MLATNAGPNQERTWRVFSFVTNATGGADTVRSSLSAAQR
jgi:hypothetical protein